MIVTKTEIREEKRGEFAKRYLELGFKRHKNGVYYRSIYGKTIVVKDWVMTYTTGEDRVDIQYKDIAELVWSGFIHKTIGEELEQ